MEGSTMGQVLCGSATTTEAIRRAIQNSQESLRALSKRHGINQKTVSSHVEKADIGRRSSNWAKAAVFYRFVRRG